MSFPSYSEYTDSGIQWLRDIPSHWKLTRFKHVFKERDLRSTDGSETLLSVSAYTGVSPRSGIIDEGDHLSRAESLEGYKICYPNDLVMNIMLAWSRGLGISKYSGIVSPAYCVFEVINENNPRFLDYLVRSNEYTGYFKAFSSGVIDSRLRIYPDVFGSLNVAIPPLQEQIKIADFLDKETSKIDFLTTEQVNLISLMKEKRQAVISHAVANGLDSSVEMKESGSTWLGKVPSHWEVCPIKYGIEVLTDFTANGSFASLAENVEYQTSGYARLIRMTDLRKGLEFEQGIWIDKQAYEYLSKSSLAGGELLMASVGSVGLVYLMPDVSYPASLAPNMYLLKTNKILDSKFLYWTLLSKYGQEQIIQMATTTAQPKLNKDNVRSVIAAIPPIEEQHQIIEFLDIKVHEIDTLIKEAEQTIELLAERRSALISATISGKIDVRNVSIEMGAA